MPTAADLKERFLNDYAEDILTLYGNAATGEGTFFQTLDDAREGMFDLLATMIKQAGDLVQVEAETSQDVVRLIGQGKLSLDDGLKLIEILRKSNEIEELREMTQKLDAIAASQAR